MNKQTRRAVRITILLILGALQGNTDGSDIRSLEVKDPVPVADNSGDTWVAAWARNGAVFTPSNDTDGFRNIGSANLSFNRIDGEDPFHLSGVTMAWSIFQNGSAIC